MDLLDRLADFTVPPVPEAPRFAAGVRRKLHPRLLAGHVAAFALAAMPWAIGQMLPALAAAVRFTVTGTWPSAERPDRGAR
ncbi:MAG: hypothetical protein FJ284_05030 [Planctomycetes bacterium]|nr:hypothetical protein [Planctomycetota bacterium]